MDGRESLIQPDAWVLAVDFGTTKTVAAAGDKHGVHVLTINGRTVTPSAVMLQEGDRPGRERWLVGELAINAAVKNPACFVREPKREIVFGRILIGGRSMPVVEPVAAVLRHVTDEAQKQHGSRPPAWFVVTHPQDWGRTSINRLLVAARAATDPTWPDPEPLAEPEAAVRSVLSIASLPAPARIGVLELSHNDGAALTIMDWDGSQLEAVHQRKALNEVPVVDFDDRLARLLIAEADADGLYDNLSVSDKPTAYKLASEVRDLARAVKEQLSVDTFVFVDVPVPAPEGRASRPVQIRRTQLEALIRGGDGGLPGLTEAVRMVTSALHDLPPGPPFAGVCLLGGSTRIPLLRTLLEQETGKPPISYGDLDTVVVRGAAAWARARAALIDYGTEGPTGGESSGWLGIWRSKAGRRRGKHVTGKATTPTGIDGNDGPEPSKADLPSPTPQAGVFISYRRRDEAGFAGRLYDRLEAEFGTDQVFMDVDSIDLGLDFVDVLNASLRVCRALVVIIGKDWLSASDRSGSRRLDNPDDYVRLEIETALERNIRVIPILVDGAQMPRRTDLPPSLAPLARRNGREMSHDRFGSDVLELITTLERLLA